MKKYIKNVFVNGVQMYGVNVEKSAEDMVATMAQWHYLKQAGEDITLDRELDAEYMPCKYIMTRKCQGKTIVHTYDIVEC